VGHARKDNAKFCSFVCFSKSKTLVTGLSHPLYTRKPRNCEYCGKEVWVIPAKLQEFRFCSRQCLGSWVMSHCHRPTNPERIVAGALEALSIPFEAEYRIGRYSCDFALPQYHIVIEADGDYWHSLPKRKALDITKDKYLCEQGWRVFRFKECNIKSDLTKCLLRLTKYIKLI
jgi:very-short-patch-repair endonuclease